jgi:acyl-CoA synthetase (AMP-forming)/AMP-acid ligase II
MLLGSRSGADVVLVDAASGATSSVDDVRARAAQLGERASALTFLVADASVASWLTALALLEARHPFALIDPGMGRDAMLALADRYAPDRIIDPAGVLVDGGGEWHADEPAAATHPDLAVLLTTSGTTGSPRFVRLSADNVARNARQIAEALSLGSEDRALTTMPLTYSFGLSVLTSHAVSGGSLVVSSRSVIEAQFWEEIERHGVTTMAGVPVTYKMLKRLGFTDRDTPVRTLIQAGGRLDPELITHFHEAMAARGGRFLVMYGQTEASPRMSVLPHELLPAKLGSVGLPLSGGRVRILDAQDGELPPMTTGRVVYSGPNVMMGYADSPADLALGDVFGDVLDTGDEGHLDEDGCLYISGRTKRICKLSGVRISLDEVESLAAAIVPDGADVAAYSTGDDALVLVVEGGQDGADDIRRALANRLKVPPKLVTVRVGEVLPRLSNGKPDYRTLQAEVVG